MSNHNCGECYKEETCIVMGTYSGRNLTYVGDERASQRSDLEAEI